MSTTTTNKTVETPRKLFPRFDAPEQIVSGNGPHFTSHEFQMLLIKKSIKHITLAFNYSSTNELPNVQSFKYAPQNKKRKLLKEKLENYLHPYREAIHTTTGETAAKLLMERKLKHSSISSSQI